MNVREAIEVLPGAKKISLTWGDSSMDINKQNDLIMDAFGTYKVRAIWSVSLDEFELEIAMQPIRETGM